MVNTDISGVLDTILSKITNKNLSIFICEKNTNKKIKDGKFLKFTIKDNIIRLDFESALSSKHENVFVLPLPYEVYFTHDEIRFSYKNSLITEYIDYDDLLDLEEQNTSKSPLYDHEIIIKWN